MSDNGPCFVSQEFEGFMKGSGIRHVRTAPYHPISNGLAERAVQLFKAGMRKQSSGSVKTKLANFYSTIVPPRIQPLEWHQRNY